jgi:hypothetical protein
MKSAVGTAFIASHKHQEKADPFRSVGAGLAPAPTNWLVDRPELDAYGRRGRRYVPRVLYEHRATK